MTVFASGISMNALAKLLNQLLGWNYHAALWICSAVVLVYVLKGGLTSAIYNEVMQFFLIVAGFTPLVFLGLRDVGGWSGLQARLTEVSTTQGFAPGAFSHSWQFMGRAADNPMGVEWFAMLMGLGFVLSFGYWCTDFLVMQRAMAAESMAAARRTPLVAAVPKMLFPFLVIFPGMIAIALTQHHGVSGLALPAKPDGALNYDLVIPLMLRHYFPSGILGLGLTALMASFMSGMAGNVTAFNTVWTYDIYQAYLRPKSSDAALLWMGRAATVVGISVSVAAAYFAAHFNNIMDLLQLVFAFVNAPLFATFLLGMFWRRTTGHAAFFGLLSGIVAAALHHGLTQPHAATSLVKGGWLGHVARVYPSEMAQNFWTAIFAWTTCFIVTILISFVTRQKKTDEQLKGLVSSLTPRITDEHVAWYKRPAALGMFVLVLVFILNIIFW